MSESRKEMNGRQHLQHISEPMNPQLCILG